jgi:transcriptional regulator with XRE-family HTH domain
MSHQNQRTSQLPRPEHRWYLDPSERAELLRAFGVKLRSLRANAGLSQVGLAARSFLHDSDISAYERSVRLPSLGVLLVLGDALDRLASALIEGLRPPIRRAATPRALALIDAHPGISTPELANALDLPYRHAALLTRRLEAENTISGFHTDWRRTPQ